MMLVFCDMLECFQGKKYYDWRLEKLLIVGKESKQKTTGRGSETDENDTTFLKSFFFDSTV